MLIGLTGQIGAGKSTVARILRKYGAHIIDADQIGREVVNRSLGLRRQLAKTFGPDILDRNGHLLRKRLAKRAFISEKTHQALNRIVHPYLLNELRRQVRAAHRHRAVVIDAALLLDWKLDREVDLVVSITAPKAIRFRRMADKGMSPADAEARQRRQLPFVEYRRRSDVIIRNINDVNRLEVILKRFWQRYVDLPD